MMLLFLTVQIAMAAAPKLPVPTSAAQCKNIRTDPKEPGHMPRGVTADNIKEYQDLESRCSLSAKGDPTYRERCEKTFQTLEYHARILNGFITDWCDTYFDPKIHGGKLPTPECTMAIQNYMASKSAPNPTQAGCSEGAMKLMEGIQGQLSDFMKNLKEFNSTLEKMQKENYKAVIQAHKEGKQIPLNTPSAPTNNGQNPLALAINPTNIMIADALMNRIRSQQGNANRYSGLTPANYREKFEPISVSWSDLHRLDKASVFQEQARAYLNTEEVLLATKTYLAESEAAALNSEKIRQQLASNTTNFGPLASAAAGAANFAGQNPNGANNDGEFSIASALSDKEGTKAKAPGISLSKTDNLKPSDKNATEEEPNRKLASVKNGIEGFTTPGKDQKTQISSTAASLAPKGSMRDSLKKAMAGKTGSSSAGKAGEEDSSGDQPKDDTATLPPDGSVPAAFGNLREQGMMDTVGSGPSHGPASGQSEFAMDSTKTDETVKAMLQEYRTFSQEAQGDYIGDSEGSSLFIRVKDFHERCLKKGCVLQLAHRKI